VKREEDAGEKGSRPTPESRGWGKRGGIPAKQKVFGPGGGGKKVLLKGKGRL